MRNRWEDKGGWVDKGGVDLDAPATISERELRALRRRAGFGVPAVLLALVSVGGLGWTLFAGPEGLEQVQSLKARVLGGVTSGPNTESRETAAPVASQGQSTALAGPQAADSVNSAAPLTAPNGEADKLASQESGR